eukprot:6338173-Prymnesium_polylepis.1
MGVTVTTIKPGDGPKPKKGNLVRAHYTGKLTNGKVFGAWRPAQALGAEAIAAAERHSCRHRTDTSRGGFGPWQKQPFEFRIGQKEVIKAWDVGIARMKVGETAQLKATSDMCYGRSGAGPIPPNSDLTFEVELLAIDTRSIAEFNAADGKGW